MLQHCLYSLCTELLQTLEITFGNKIFWFGRNTDHGAARGATRVPLEGAGRLESEARSRSFQQRDCKEWFQQRFWRHPWRHPTNIYKVLVISKSWLKGSVLICASLRNFFRQMTSESKNQHGSQKYRGGRGCRLMEMWKCYSIHCSAQICPLSMFIIWKAQIWTFCGNLCTLLKYWQV